MKVYRSQVIVHRALASAALPPATASKRTLSPRCCLWSVAAAALCIAYAWMPPLYHGCPSGGPRLGSAASAFFAGARRRHVRRNLRTWGTLGYVPYRASETRKDVREAQYQLKVDGELLGNAARRHGLRGIRNGAAADFVVMSYRALGSRMGVVVPPGYLYSAQYCTIGAPQYAAASGRVRYEVTLRLLGKVPQMGWAWKGAFGLSPGQENRLGVGDGDDGWAVDGVRGKLWHKGAQDWGTRWKDGDVIGFAADLTAGRMLVARNGQWETVFQGLLGPVFPALSSRECMMEVNLGGPFRYPAPHPNYTAVGAAHGGTDQVRLLRGARGSLQTTSSQLPESGSSHPVFSGLASDGGPRVVSQFPLARGQISLAAALGGACSLEDKGSMARCLEALPEGRPPGVPPGYLLSALPGSEPDKAAWDGLDLWFRKVEAELAGGGLRGFVPRNEKQRRLAWIVKDCVHRTGGKGIEVLPSRAAAVRSATEMFQTPWPKSTVATVPRARCVLVQRYLVDALRLPWGPSGTIDPAGRRFSIRIYSILASLSPFVLYWNPPASAVMLAGASSTEWQSRAALLNSWTGVHRRTWQEFWNYVTDRKAARGRWQPADVAAFIPRVGSLLHSVLSVHNATVQRAGSFNVVAFDLMVTAEGLRPIHVESNLEGSSRRVNESLAMFERVFDILTLPDVCSRETHGNWVRARPHGLPS
eukprot:TRINITY_DN3279_c0_g2_i3.p1 TRINITY_DN3279_c0_g2~~TRINITY_DN3279_c0_g2_i3.p1  ORF type:complete len:702 (+),score=110.16 TRINITY_DN3279_c0_g2_i3:120-2225(+)